MHLPRVARPILSRASAVARAHSRGVVPQGATVPYNPAVGCSPAGAGWTQCGGPYANARFPNMQMILCCDPAEVCDGNGCVPRDAIRQELTNYVPGVIAGVIDSYL